jgi:hypothetical protein
MQRTEGDQFGGNLLQLADALGDGVSYGCPESARNATSNTVVSFQQSLEILRTTMLLFLCFLLAPRARSTQRRPYRNWPHRPHRRLEAQGGRGLHLHESGGLHGENPGAEHGEGVERGVVEQWGIAVMRFCPVV